MCYAIQLRLAGQVKIMNVNRWDIALVGRLGVHPREANPSQPAN